MAFSSVLGASSVIKPGVCTSTTRPSVPYDGQLIYETDTNLVKAFDGTAFVTVGPSGVVQVKSTAKTDTFTTASATFTGVTGLTVSITPTSASNKVLVIAQVAYAMANGAGYGHFKLSGGNTTAYVGDSPGNRIAAVFGGFSSANESISVLSASIVFLDSPATTSATTYGIDVRTSSGGSVFINRAAADSNDDSKTRGASSITVFEVTP